MKKISAIIAALVISASAASVTAFADSETGKVKVSISGPEGTPVMIREDVDLKDTDGDGMLTINDVLYQAHETYYEGGAEAGYATAKTDWGLSLKKLWGVENGGSYGYYVNNSYSMGLSDQVNDGDEIYAFIYTDLTGWSDSYSFFDCVETEAEAGSTMSFKLSRYAYDENWQLVTLPAANAVITIDGEETEFVTDKDGNVEFSIDEPGDYVISAVSKDVILVPPLMELTINPAEGDSSKSGDSDSDSDTVSGSDSTTDSAAGESDSSSKSDSKAETTTTTTTTTKGTTAAAGGGSDNTAKAENAETGSSTLGLMVAGVASLAAAVVIRRKNNG